VHPGAWLTWAVCAGLVAVSTSNPFYLIVLIAAAWAVHAGRRAEVPGSWSFGVFLAFGLAAMVTRTVLVVFGSVTWGSVAAAALEGMKLATLLVVYGTFSSVSDPYRILRLAPRRLHEPALAAALALSIAPRTIAAAVQVREAQRMRGMDARRWRSIPALAVPVLETGMEEAVSLAESMDARGHGRGPRRTYRRQRFSRWAWMSVVVSSLAAAAFLAAGLSGRVDLFVSTFPLRWPNVSVMLVIAVTSFAVPAFLPREDSR
jgi:energy-coupling factor transport system permease protein